ncbi:MAG: copper resistance protein, partial [Mycobacterium sp.]|nr:copper resistance protein [Mycobacterium sp.]
YRVTSADGHVVSGSWSFRLTTPGTGTPGPVASTPSAPGGVPAWPFIAAGVLVVVGAAWWRLRRRLKHPG